MFCNVQTSPRIHTVVAAGATSFIDMAGESEKESLVFIVSPAEQLADRMACVREASVCYVATAVRLTRVDSFYLSWALVHAKRAMVANGVSPAALPEFDRDE